MPTSPRDAVLRYFGFPKLDAIERLDDEERKEKRALVDKLRKNLSITLDFEKKSRSSQSPSAITAWARRRQICTGHCCRSAAPIKPTSRI